MNEVLMERTPDVKRSLRDIKVAISILTASIEAIEKQFCSCAECK